MSLISPFLSPKMSFWSILMIIFFSANRIRCLTQIDFTTLEWVLTNGNESISVLAKVPGGVYGTLMDQGLLVEGDFYYRYNDLNYRYVSYQNWTYKTQFTVSEELLNETRIFLSFQGIDTIGSIFLDDVDVGETNNMFVTYHFDVKPQLKANFNHSLRIFLRSPVQWSKESYENHLKNYQVPPSCVDPSFRGECHANHIRKMQSSFGWDWGPAFPNLGLWKPLKLIGWTSLTIENILFETQLEKKLNIDNQNVFWKVDLKIFWNHAVKNLPVAGNLRILVDNVTYVDGNVAISSNDTQVGYKQSFYIPEDSVELWWPNGYGQHRLYNLTVKWTTDSEISEKTIKIGFRTVELDQNYLNESQKDLGRHFRFVVNNVTIFMKGSNWIPAHVLPEKVPEGYARQILQDAAATHQNCLRVWGGGIYEQDSFYEAADELGILLWQDFMFACSMYPTDQKFMNSVQMEIDTQVKRLQHHPSILLWSGNNENEAALRGNWYGTVSNFSLYKSDYVELYVHVIRRKVLEMDQSRPFVVSSPSNGLESEQEGFVAQNPYDNRYGDTHYYNYIKDGWESHHYPRTRFASEYGFQSWPSIQTMKEVTKESDRWVNSPMMSHRQHHPMGNVQLAWQLMSHFRTTDLFFFGYKERFQSYLYLTQIFQAMAVQSETEFYRRGRNEMDENGQGFTSGALYWQLNDIWQGASWSSIEYGGRWKMLHYFSAKFFSPVLISLVINENKISFYGISDLREDLINLKLTITIRSFLQFQPLRIVRTAVNISALSSHIVATYDLEKDLKFSDICYTILFKPKNICYITVHLRSPSKDVFKSTETYLFLNQPRNFVLKKARIYIVQITEHDDRKFTIHLQTKSVALFVWLETKVEGIFTDNGFLMHHKRKSIVFTARQNTTAVDLFHSLSVTSLVDTYDAQDVWTHFHYHYSVSHKNHINPIL